MKLPLLFAMVVFIPVELAFGQVHRPGKSTEAKPARSSPSPAASQKVSVPVPKLSPDSIPLASIPVLANALGDVVHDNSLDVRDLLRIRDIAIGRPPTPTGYERAEADLNVDGSVNAADVDIIRDILLRKIGVPYLIDSTGGDVLGSGITLHVPPGAVAGTLLLSVKRHSESEFAAGTGVDTKGGVADSVYLMTSFEITSNTPDFKLPVGATIKLDSMPPCAYQGLNGLFAAAPDRDGDGLSELFLINELIVNSDSLTVTAGDIPVPSIKALSLSQAEPGQALFVTGHGFGNHLESIVIRFRPTGSDTTRVALPSVCDDSTIIVTVPGVPEGQCKVTVENVLTGLTSNAMQFVVVPFSAAGMDIRATIVGAYMQMAASIDSAIHQDLLSSIEDTTVRSHFQGIMLAQRASIDSEISYFSLLPDSLLEEWRFLAAFVQNMDQSVPVEETYLRPTYSRAAQCPCDAALEQARQVADYIEWLSERYWKRDRPDCLLKLHELPLDCGPCKVAERTRKILLESTDMEALWRNEYRKCMCYHPECPGGGGCGECLKTAFVGYGPKGMKVSGGYNPSGGFSTSGCCINIIRYKRNPCITVPAHWRPAPVPIEPDPALTCPPPPTAGYVLSMVSESVERPHAGSVIRVTNAPVPYHIVGILNENGHAFIPQVPMNTKVTYSVYDPVTGFYDPDAGTYTTGSTPGGFDWPVLLFRPNTQIKTCLLTVGEPVHDSVSVDLQRIDYLLTIGAADTSTLFNIGFSASTHLALNIVDPHGSLLFNNADVACYSTAHVRFSKVGTYRIWVALGVSAQPGSFDLGVSHSPYSPIASNCLCSPLLVDSLYAELSPYTVKCETTVPTGDTLTIEAGVSLELGPGAKVVATGTLAGVGSPEKPITLMPSGPSKLGIATVKRVASGRKEVQP